MLKSHWAIRTSASFAKPLTTDKVTLLSLKGQQFNYDHSEVLYVLIFVCVDYHNINASMSCTIDFKLGL